VLSDLLTPSLVRYGPQQKQKQKAGKKKGVLDFCLA